MHLIAINQNQSSMRNLIVLAVLLVSSLVTAQDNLSTEAWIEDLDFLQTKKIDTQKRLFLISIHSFIAGKTFK